MAKRSLEEVLELKPTAPGQYRAQNMSSDETGPTGPHRGVGYARAHETLSTGPVSHTIVYHEPVDAGQWNLLNVHAVHAGAGRSFGYGDMVTQEGRLVASFAQVNMIREMPAGSVL